MPTITLLYAGLLGLISVAIAFQAGILRGKLNISIGDGSNRELLLAMHRHANFTEWVPIALILIALLEIKEIPAIAVHVFGASLVVFRIAHALGLKADTIKGFGRAFGAGGTALIVVIASVWAIVEYFK